MSTGWASGAGAAGGGGLGHPRVHLRCTDSTNERARELAAAGAPSGTLVTAAEQTAGRGRQGRGWVAPAGSALLCSLVLRRPPPLLSLIAGVAVCDAVDAMRPTGERARVKWPNDVLAGPPASCGAPPALAGGAQRSAEAVSEEPAPALAKLAGILVEGRPQEGWAVLGIGVNVAVRPEDLPAELRDSAASLGLPPSAIEPTLQHLLGALERRLAEPAQSVLAAWRERDALLGRAVVWAGGEGRAHGIDDAGRLLVRLGSGAVEALDAGEVHLGRA